MTRERAYEVASALEDIHDFERFMDEIVCVYDNIEGNLDEFFHNELLPLAAERNEPPSGSFRRAVKENEHEQAVFC